MYHNTISLKPVPVIAFLYPAVCRKFQCKYILCILIAHVRGTVMGIARSLLWVRYAVSPLPPDKILPGTHTVHLFLQVRRRCPLPIHSVPPSYLDLPWKISLQFSSEIKRIVIHVGLQRLYCFFCPYTHFHFKCRPQMLICINFNRPVMNPHNFSHHRKSKPHTSKFPAS